MHEELTEYCPPKKFLTLVFEQIVWVKNALPKAATVESIVCKMMSESRQESAFLVSSK